MDVEEIRALRRADPFEPFHLVLHNGRKLPVDEPHYLAISPDGLLLAHALVEGGFDWFPPAAVAKVDFHVNRPAVQKQRETAAILYQSRWRA